MIADSRSNAREDLLTGERRGTMAQDLDALVVELSEANGLAARKEKVTAFHSVGRQSAAGPVQDSGLKTELDAIRQILKSLQSEAILRAELDGARQLIKALQDQVKDLRADRDHWRQRAESASRS